MNEHGRNETDIFRCLDVEYTPEGHSEVYRWDDFLKIAGGHVHSAMYLIDMVSAGGEYEGEEPEYAYACEIVGCCGLRDGVALFRPVSHDGANLIQIAFLRNDVDDATGAYTERFEAGSFGVPSDVLPCSEFGVDLLEYFNGRSLKYTPGVNRGLDAREAVNSIEDAIGCDLGLFGGVKLDCSKIGFDEVAAAAASNGLDSVLAYLEESPRGLEPLCDIAVRRADGGQADAVERFGRQDEAMAMLSAITGCRIQAYGADTLIYRASLDNAAAAKLAAGALAMKDCLSGRGGAVEHGPRI